MKRLSIALLILLSGCSSTNMDNSQSVASTIYVESKEISEDESFFFINAYDPAEDIKESLELVIEEASVWNLIEVEETYFAVYSTDNGDDWTLDQVQVVGQENVR